MQILLSALRFCDVHFTPACLKAGGATYDYLTHFSVPRLRLKGRWSSDKSLDHYVQESTALMISESFPEAALARARPLSLFCFSLLAFFTSSQSLPPTPAAPLSFIQKIHMRTRLASLAQTGTGGRRTVTNHENDDD